MSLDDQIRVGDQQLKVQQAWDDRVEKFTRLEMEVQSHIFDMMQKQFSILVDAERYYALKHARLTLTKRVKRLSVKVLKAEKQVERIEKHINTFYNLLSPRMIRSEDIGRHWSSIAHYVKRSKQMFPASSGGEVFKKSQSDPYFPIKSEEQTAGEFVAFCRYNALLVKPKTPLFLRLEKVVEEAEAEAGKQIEKLTEEVDKFTIQLSALLENHWKTQEI